MLPPRTRKASWASSSLVRRLPLASRAFRVERVTMPTMRRLNQLPSPAPAALEVEYLGPGQIVGLAHGGQHRHGGGGHAHSAHAHHVKGLPRPVQAVDVPGGESAEEEYLLLGGDVSLGFVQRETFSFSAWPSIWAYCWEKPVLD